MAFTALQSAKPSPSFTPLGSTPAAASSPSTPSLISKIGGAISNTINAAKQFVLPPTNYAPSLYDQANPALLNPIQKAVSVGKAEVAGAVSGFQNTPSAPKTTDFVEGIGGGTQNAAESALHQGVDNLSKQLNIITDAHTNALQKGAATAEAVVGTVNSVFGILLSPLQGYATVPVLGNAIDGLNKIFGAIGNGAGAGAAELVNQLPISQATKDTITPAVHDTAALVAQMVAGKAAGDLGKTAIAKIADNSKAIMTELSNDPAIKAAIEAQKNAPAEQPAPTVHQLAKSVQDQMPNLQASRAYDIAERANELHSEARAAFIKSELAKINPKSLPTYPSEPIRATAAETTPVLAANEAARPTEDNQPPTAYEPYTPENQLPVIQMGAKPKTAEPVIQAEAPPVRKVPGDFTIEPIKPTTASPNAVQEPTARPVQATTARAQEPPPKPLQVEPGTSRIGKSIEAKAVEAKLTQGFDKTAGYDTITVKDQAQKATSLINDNIDTARAVVRGEQPLPEGLRGTALITAMEEHIKANPNPEMAYELANSPLVSEGSAAAQEMRLMAERVPDSITAKYREIKSAREAAIEKRGGLQKATKSITDDIKKEIKSNASKRVTWEEFIKEVQCAY
jgi:hypothetical protein